MKHIIFVSALLILAVQSHALKQILGGYVSQPNPSEYVMDLAKWACKSLPQYTKINAEYTPLLVKDVQTQLVAGVNYKFTLEVLLGTPENKYSVSLKNMAKTFFNVRFLISFFVSFTSVKWSFSISPGHLRDNSPRIQYAK